MPPSRIPPVRLRPERRENGATAFRLPLALRLLAARDTQPAVLLAEDLPAPVLTVEDKNGRALAVLPLAGGRPEGVLLPRGAERLVLPPGGGSPALGWYPLGRPVLWLQARLSGAHPAKAVLKAVRAQLKRALWTSPAADRFSRADCRRALARHAGAFGEVPAPGAAPRMAFVSAAGDIPLARLMQVARALAAQTDPAFEWILAVPPARRTAEGGALDRLPARLVEAEGDATAQLAAAIAAAGSGLLVPLDPAGEPTRDAVALLRATFAARPDCALAYTDEAFRDAGGAVAGVAFKPAFNRHLLIAGHYTGSLVALPATDARALGLRAELGGAALHDLVLRQAEAVSPSRILHIPRVAWLGPARETDGFAPEDAARAAAALSARLGCPVETAPVDPASPRRQLRPLYPVPTPEPLVSIIVPTRDRAELLGTTLRTLIAGTSYRAFEIVIVDNGSREAETFALFDEIRALWPATRIVADGGDFNFARICNAGIAAASGALILLLNNDMEIVEPDWLSEMVALSALPGTGIVGAKLLYPNRTVQHAGFIVGLREGAGGHWFVGAGESAGGYRGRLAMRQNLSAVTGACLLVSRACLDAIGRLDAVRFAEDCNDIDLCLRARRAGFEVVFTPFARLIHHESASRLERADAPISEKRRAEWARFEALWAPARHVDPHFSPNLRRDSVYALPARTPGPRAPRTDMPGTGETRTDEDG